MLKISYAGCLGLSPVISAQFMLEMCVAAWNRERFTKNPILGFKVIDVGTPAKLVSSACCDKLQVCVYMQPSTGRWAQNLLARN